MCMNGTLPRTRIARATQIAMSFYDQGDRAGFINSFLEEVQRYPNTEEVADLNKIEELLGRVFDKSASRDHVERFLNGFAVPN